MRKVGPRHSFRRAELRRNPGSGLVLPHSAGIRGQVLFCHIGRRSARACLVLNALSARPALCNDQPVRAPTAIPSQRKNRQTADAPTGCASRGWINLPRSGFVQQFVQAELASLQQQYGRLSLPSCRPHYAILLNSGIRPSQMVRIRIDLPVFSSPTEAFGYAGGELDLSALPKTNTLFPWPEVWVEARPTYFSDDQSLIWGVSPCELPGAEFLVTMYGIVCKSSTDAQDCANFLEQVSGLEFNEY
jgi:hypothetical protein